MIRLGRILLLTGVLAGCGEGDQGQVVILANQALEAHFADNGSLASYHNHPEGLNGIARLRHASQPDRDIFERSQAGINYEISSLNGVEDTTWEETSEPRRFPMTIEQLGADSVELYQAATARKQVEARIRFTLVEDPAAVDFDLEFTLHKQPEGPKEAWERDFFVLFASYMYDPEDHRLYFFGSTPDNPQPRWLRVDALVHGDPAWAEERDGQGHYEQYFVDRPYFAGTVADILVVVLIDPAECFGFWYSPSGGMNFDHRTPAWDFTLGFDGVTVLDPIEVRGRLLLIPGGTLEDVEPAYQGFKAGL
jgi:hypothetical protein